MGRYPLIETPRTFGAAGQPPFTAPWVAFTATRPPLFYKDEVGLVHIEGTIVNTNGAVAVNDFIVALPAGYAPSNSLFSPGGSWYMTNTGGIYSNVAGAAGSVVLYLDRIIRPV